MFLSHESGEFADVTPVEFLFAFLWTDWMIFMFLWVQNPTIRLVFAIKVTVIQFISSVSEVRLLMYGVLSL